MTWSLGFGNCPGGVDEADVAEALREVDEQFAGLQAHLLDQQIKTFAKPATISNSFRARST
jgi:hypothetical protein